ncbi:hypothetical protein DPMN_076676 [Dreissena polymorpha]|uniref:Secreted protein n=1 Tax=Dreissena polymorpha TaxID=45954 RepID=A0A9D3YJ55_DREPO|nr:hypothetical protein DPMN_076676 [Dreissena polymorpha]
MKMKTAMVMIVVCAACFVFGEKEHEELIDPEELYLRQKLEFVNALGYESYSMVELAEEEEQGTSETGHRLSTLGSSNTSSVPTCSGTSPYQNELFYVHRLKSTGIENVQRKAYEVYWNRLRVA